MRDKAVLLGVTGSVAAYKAVELASALAQSAVKVDVVMTTCAIEFITPLTFRSITHRPVITDMSVARQEYEIEHIALAEQADVVVVAPTTANILAKLAVGIADDVLSCTILAARAPIVLAPAMDALTWENVTTEENVARLRRRGVKIVEPSYGSLGCREAGEWRLAEVRDVMRVVRRILDRREIRRKLPPRG